MQIVRERPCQRRHHRVTAPMKVTLSNGQTITATDWSLGGLRLDGLGSNLPKIDEVIELLLELPFQGFDISFDVKAKVTRSSEDEKVLGVEFEELSERAHDLMEHFINDLVRGKMATIDDTICRIDVPVTPISTKPDTNPASEMPVKRWPIKTMVMSAFYVLLGVFVFSYLAILIYSNVMRMEIETAVVTKQLRTISMPVEGEIIPVKMKAGTKVKKGEVIARVKGKATQVQLVSKQIEYADKTRAYELAVRRYHIESQRLKIYEIASQTEAQIAKARLEAAHAALISADLNVERTGNFDLNKESAKLKYDDALLHQEEMEARVREAELMVERAIAMSAVSDRRHFTEDGFVADLDLLALDVETANAELAKLQDEIDFLEQQSGEHTIRAPFSGQILQIADLQGQSFAKDHALLTIEKREVPKVQAFLSQDEVLSVGLNDDASIYLPSLGETITAKVVHIDRKAGHINGEMTNYIWRESDAKTALVSLELNANEISGNQVTAGLPAVVIFSKRSTNQIYDQLGEVVSQVAEVFVDGNSIRHF